MERTLIIFKPDAVQRGLCGEILTRFEKKGIQIVGLKAMKIPSRLLRRTTRRTRASRSTRGS
jgi:nucleoside-diphosphate kinase